MTTDPLPFRFKAGGNGHNMAASAVHHHRNDTCKPNKPFKSKFASKGSLKDRDKGMKNYMYFRSFVLSIVQVDSKREASGRLPTNKSCPKSLDDTKLARSSRPNTKIVSMQVAFSQELRVLPEILL
jgi:hypothetical protein